MDRISLIISLILLWATTLSSQCVYRDTVALEDLSANNFYLEIQDVINDDLSDPNQGVCGVNVAFLHDRLGNLLIELISPAGEMVALVGPTETGNMTPFTIWDVSFVPCSGTAVPDMGFSAQWDNDQSWGGFGDYSGSYYPFNGCLEDFDEGPVNGTWTLHVEDNLQFDDGTFIEFSILFCDPSGISCQTCFSDAGSFVISGAYLCETQTSQFAWPPAEYEDGQQPDTSLYGYQYVLSVKDSIIDTYHPEEQPTVFPNDTFDVCGMSYLHADSNTVDTLAGIQTVSSLDSALSSFQPPFCASLTDVCTRYYIDSMPPVTDDSVYLCTGSSVQYGDSTFTEAGNYLVEINRQTGCDSAVSVEVLPFTIEANIAMPDTISCDRTEVELDATGSQLTDSTEVHWTTPNGSFASDTDTLNVLVNSPGDYVLLLDNGSCWDTTRTTVVEINNEPNAIATGDTIDCGADSVQLSAGSVNPGDSLSWSGPGGFESSDSNPWVFQAGMYILTVSTPAGCMDMDTAIVGADGQLPRAEISSDPLDCTTDSVQLMVQDTAFINGFSWSGPMGFTSGQLEPVVTRPGWYDLELVFSQQCVTTISYQVLIDTTPPEYQLIGDTLTCIDTLGQLSVSSQDSLMIQWNGPMGFTSTGDSVQVDRAGWYDVQISGNNGCMVRDSIRLLEFIQPPTFILGAEQLGCPPDSALISLTFLDSSSVASVSWEGPGGFSSGETSPSVTEEGVYQVEVTGINGCMANGVTQVMRNEDSPEINLSADTLSCTLDSVVIQLNTSDTLAELQWTGPDGFTDERRNPVVYEEGWYVVWTRAVDSCTTTDSIFVPSVRESPDIMLQLASLSCQDSTFTIESEVQPIDADLEWMGPEVINSDSMHVTVETPGWYYLTATNEMGCQTTDSILLLDTLMGPQFELDTDTLNCINSSAVISMSPVEAGWTFNWEGPDFTSQQSSPVVDREGWYAVTVTDEDGCIGVDSIQLIQDTMSPDIILADTLISDKCAADSASIILDAVGSSSGPNFSINWSQISGNILSGSGTLTPEVTIPGHYVVQITNNRNGCTTGDSIDVFSNPTQLNSVDFTVISPSCVPDKSGGLIINEITGGDPPYNVTIDDSTYTTFLMDTIPLEPRQYSLLIEDGNGCQMDTTFDVSSTNPPNVEVGPDITIEEGERIWLSGTVSGSSSLERIQWIPAGLSDPDSLSLEVMPSATQLYRLTVFDERGCTASDSLTVYVETSDNIYIPNTFTPNNDGINDRFYVQSGSDALTIRRFQIYDRWGNMVFEQRNIHPNDPATGWDGRFNGQRLSPQVFIYVVEIRQSNGRITRYSGDVTLVR